MIVMYRVSLIVNVQYLLLELSVSNFSDHFQNFGNVELGVDNCPTRFFLREGD